MDDAWSRFERTGTVRDYLDYVSQRMNQKQEDGDVSVKSKYSEGYEGKVESTRGTTDETDGNRTLF